MEIEEGVEGPCCNCGKSHRQHDGIGGNICDLCHRIAEGYVWVLVSTRAREPLYFGSTETFTEEVGRAWSFQSEAEAEAFRECDLRYSDDWEAREVHPGRVALLKAGADFATELRKRTRAIENITAEDWRTRVK